MTDLVFDRDRARKHVLDLGLWPQMGERPENAAAQEWWLGLLKRVMWSVNDHDWNEEQYPDDKYTEIVDQDVDSYVAQARSDTRVMTICEVSRVHAVVTTDSDGIYVRLLSFLFEARGDEKMFPRRGENTDEWMERREQGRRDHQEKCRERLELGEFTEIYLSAAADLVARPWAEEMADDWREANPPEDEDEDGDDGV